MEFEISYVDHLKETNKVSMTIRLLRTLSTKSEKDWNKLKPIVYICFELIYVCIYVLVGQNCVLQIY